MIPSRADVETDVRVPDLAEGLRTWTSNSLRTASLKHHDNTVIWKPIMPSPGNSCQLSNTNTQNRLKPYSLSSPKP